MTKPIYAIGDIHGQKTMLETALARIENDGGRDAETVFLGDYVDRGPDSRGVIDTLVSGIAAGRNWICLKGNHDRMFEWFVEDPAPRSDPHLLVGYHWFHGRLGGVETIDSYGVTMPGQIRQTALADLVKDAMPDSHRDFLRNLKVSHHVEDFFFAHAGIRPGVPLDRQVENDLVWIREEFLNDTRQHGAFVIHGHSPVAAPDRRSNRLNIDTGAGYGKPLTAIVIEDGEMFVLGKDGREPILADDWSPAN